MFLPDLFAAFVVASDKYRECAQAQTKAGRIYMHTRTFCTGTVCPLTNSCFIAQLQIIQSLLVAHSLEECMLYLSVGQHHKLSRLISWTHCWKVNHNCKTRQQSTCYREKWQQRQERVTSFMFYNCGAQGTQVNQKMFGLWSGPQRQKTTYHVCYFSILGNVCTNSSQFQH